MSEEVRYSCWDFLALDLSGNIIASHTSREMTRLAGISRGCRFPVVVRAYDYFEAERQRREKLILELAGVPKNEN